MKQSKKNIASSTGLIAALASSLCCIAPLLSIIAGVSGGATMFDWISPYRPYLIAISVLALGYAFYQAYRPIRKDDCGCEVDQKSSFLNAKGFLWTITFISLLMFTFPYYSGAFYATDDKAINGQTTQEITMKVQGMTCESCESHVNAAALKLNGVYSAKSSFQNGETTIVFAPDEVGPEAISEAIEQETGYTIIE